MWELYNLLKDGVGENHEYLIDDVFELMGKITSQKFILSLKLFYKDFAVENKSPVDVALLFVRGLKKNKFFEFVDFIKAFNGRSKHG
jgi:hypothetical protein